MNSSTTKLIDQVKISIGLPVFNGEKFIQKCIESWLAQTFTNFELIISDNASTDSTSKIYEEYAKKDKRIRIFRQEKNMGVIWNFNFVLKEAKYDYFVWAGVDDYVHPDFLKKNIEALISNNNLVGSGSKIERYGMDESHTDSINLKFGNLVKNLRLRFSKREVHPISGTYGKKVRTYLKKSTCQIIYGVLELKNYVNP
ncbi:MAG: glycosyltransferase family 2 protein [Nitrosotalea sp.]